MITGRVEVKVGGFTVLDMNIWTLWRQQMMQRGEGFTFGELVQVFIDGEEILDPVQHEEE